MGIASCESAIHTRNDGNGGDSCLIYRLLRFSSENLAMTGYFAQNCHCERIRRILVAIQIMKWIFVI